VIKREQFLHLILGFLFINLLSCGLPQIARYSSFDYTRDEYEFALKTLWDSFPEYGVDYKDIVNYAADLEKDSYFVGYKSELGVDSLTQREIEYRFFHNDKSKLWSYQWIIKTKDNYMWCFLSLNYRPLNKIKDCVLALTYIKRNDSLSRLENFESLKKKERSMIVKRFEDDILVQIKNIIDNKRNKNAL